MPRQQRHSHSFTEGDRCWLHLLYVRTCFYRLSRVQRVLAWEREREGGEQEDTFTSICMHACRQQYKTEETNETQKMKIVLSDKNETCTLSCPAMN